MARPKEQASLLGIALVLIAGVAFVWWELRPVHQETPLDVERDASKPKRLRECLRSERLIREEEARLNALVARSRPRLLRDAVDLLGTPSDACHEAGTRSGTVWVTSWSPRLVVPLTEDRVLAQAAEPGVGYLVRVWTRGSCQPEALIDSLTVGQGEPIALACSQYIYDRE